MCSDPVDIETLKRAAATRGGLLTDEVRRKVWPKLLNINVYNLPHRPGGWLSHAHVPVGVSPQQNLFCSRPGREGQPQGPQPGGPGCEEVHETLP